MKKIFKSLLLGCIMISTFAAVNAAPKDDLISYLNQEHVIAGKVVNLTASQKTQIERYLKSYTVTDSQVLIFKSNVEEIKKVMSAAKVTDPSKLSDSDKTKVVNLAKDAALTVGITITFNSTNNRVELYNDSGALIDVFLLNEGKLPFTGTNTPFHTVAFAITTIIAMVFIFKKGILNEA